MEWLLALLATGLSAAYAVALGRGIEKRKQWALEMARAVAMLHPSSADRFLLQGTPPSEPPDAPDELNPEVEAVDRLAA